MPNGPGKYDKLCTLVRELSTGKAVVILIAEGEEGSGFSVQGSPRYLATLPAVLRGVADQIERDLQEPVP